MSLMLDIGSEPVGEIYQTPPDGRDVPWLIGHFYNGTEVKLIKFEKPLSMPEPNSPMDRIYTLEDNHTYSAKLILKLFEFINNLHGTDLGISELSQHIIECEEFIAMRDELNVRDEKYLISNFDLLRN